MQNHDGHRARMKERFRKEGLDNFDEVYVLELLLFYCIPRQDTKPLAYALLQRFGNLANVLDASASELEQVPGVGKSVSTFLSLITQVDRYYHVSRSDKRKYMKSIDDCGKFMQSYFYGRNVETVFMLCLNAKGHVITCQMLGEGSLNSATVPIRKAVEVALNVRASSVILGHNHPSGHAIPTGADVAATNALADALQAVDVILADHLIFDDTEFVSLQQSRMFTRRHRLPL